MTDDVFHFSFNKKFSTSLSCSCPCANSTVSNTCGHMLYIPQIDLFRHELWEFRTYYFNYRGAFYSVHFHTAILS